MKSNLFSDVSEKKQKHDFFQWLWLRIINPPKYYYFGSGILKRRTKDRKNRKQSANKERGNCA